jgi:hypothetical protein
MAPHPSPLARHHFSALGLACESGGQLCRPAMRFEDLVAMLHQVRRRDAAWGQLPPVEEEDSHEARRITASHAFVPPSLNVKSFRSGRVSILDA